MPSASKRCLLGTVCVIGLVVVSFSVDWKCDELFRLPLTRWSSLGNKSHSVNLPRPETKPATKKKPNSIQNTCDASIQKTTSVWFRQRFNISICPVWREENIDVDQESYKWWMKIQKRKDDDLLEAIKELFDTGVPRHAPTKPGGCLSCAVVGSSDNLLEHTNGERIDNHTYVIRFNSAVTEGYEKHVGRKTTHHVMYPESSKSKLNHSTSYLLVPFKPPDLRWMTSMLGGKPYKFTSWAKAPSKLDINGSKVEVVHPAFMRYIHRNWLGDKGTYPSTGLIGLMYAIHQCDQVSVFGFGANSKGQWMHYYEKLSGKHTQHDGSAEKDIIDTLAKENIIEVYR